MPRPQPRSAPLLLGPVGAATPTPATGVVITSSFVAILQACAQHLIDLEVLEPERIFRIARDHLRIEHYTAPQDILLRPGGFTVDVESMVGGGRRNTILHRDLIVIIRTRMDLDKGGVDKEWLEQAARGHIQLEESVLNAFQGFYPVNDDGDSITVESMRIKAGAMPDKENIDKYDDWGYSVLTFDVAYYPPLDPSNCM